MNEAQSNPEGLVSVAEAGGILNLSDQRVRKLIASGTLRAVKISRSWAIHRQAVEEVRHLISTSSSPIKKPRKDSGNLKALSFFSGAMGLDLGLERAGIRTILACESDRWARETIACNRNDISILGDIWRYSATDIRKEVGLASDEQIDLVAGGPPCQAFSTAGARKGFEDERGNVFLHYLRLIADLRPRYVVIENVRGLLSMPIAPSQAKEFASRDGVDYTARHGAIRLVCDRLSDAGYTVSFNLYNAANFGAPQIRERVVIVGTLSSTPVPYLVPTHHEDGEFDLQPWVTFREAVDGLDAEGAKFVPFPEKRLRYLKLLKPGQNWRNLPDGLREEAMGKSLNLGGGKTGFYRRLSWDRPTPTLVTHPAMPATYLGHPVLDRPLSVEEYKRLQQFPDDWRICGPIIQQYKQIGNAVPLALGEAIGRAIIAHSNGVQLSPPNGFRFSRYSCTSDQDILRAGERAAPKLF